jgi:hypothetical protein
MQTAELARVISPLSRFSDALSREELRGKTLRISHPGRGIPAADALGVPQKIPDCKVLGRDYIPRFFSTWREVVLSG